MTVPSPTTTETPNPLAEFPNTTDLGDDPTTVLIDPMPRIVLVKSITDVADTNGSGLTDAGDTVTYEFVVTNTGNVNLAPVVIDDAFLGLTAAACVDSLAPGASATCSTTGSHVLTQADVDAGGVENTATATGTPVDSAGAPIVPVGSTTPLADVTDVSDTGTTPAYVPVVIADPAGVDTPNPLVVNPNSTDTGDDPTTLLVQPVPAIELVKSVTSVVDTTGDGLIGAGDTVSYEFVVTNTGNVTLAPVTIDDTKLGLVAAACTATLAPGATATCSTTASYVFTQADVDAGGVENTTIATGTPPAALGLAPVTDVSDTGTTPETDPAPIADPAGEDTANPLAVNPNTTDPGDDPTTVLIAPHASIVLVKSITDVTDTTGDTLIGAGDTVTYGFVVTNTGNVTLAPVTISDATLGLAGAACVDTLAPGASAICTTIGSYVLTVADVDAGGVENTAVTTGTPVDQAGDPLVPVGSTTPLADVTDISDTGTTPATVPAPIADPAAENTDNPLAVFPNAADNGDDPTTLLVQAVPRIELVKSIAEIADTNGSGRVDAGDTVLYQFDVTNTGNVTLAPVTLDDALLGLSDAACVASLAPGASATCSTVGSHVLTQADVDAGGVENTATATGTPPASSGLPDVSDVSDTGTAPDAGATPVADPAGEDTPNPFAVYPNTTDPGDDPTTAIVTPLPAIELVKSVTSVVDTTGDGLIGAGDTVYYDFAVTNTGNVTLAPVVIDDVLLGLTAAPCVDTLAPGATATCSTTASWVFTQADVDAGGVENTATATGNPPAVFGLPAVVDISDTGTTPATAPVDVLDPAATETANPLAVNPNTTDLGDDPTTVLIEPSASITLVKSITDVADTNGSGLTDAGDTVTYGFTVTNTGNVHLAPVTITDPTPALAGAACVDNLAPGASAVCSTTGTYVLSQADVDAGGIENTAITTGSPATQNGDPLVPVGSTTPLADVTDVSDTGTTPETAPVGIADPAVVDTGNPLNTYPNTTDPGDDPTTLLVEPQPSIVLVKSLVDLTDTTGDGLIGVDDTATYSFVVTNTGNVTLAPVTISDATLGLTDAACVDTLAPAATATCSTVGEYHLTQADVDADGRENTATATGTPPAVFGLPPVTDVSDTGTEPTVDHLTVTDPATTETDNPFDTFPNDPGVPGDDPTTLILGLGSIAGSVYVDTNNDGVFDATEVGIAGVTVTLTGTDDLGNVVSLTMLTDGNGDYLFAGLRRGEYTITETQPTEYLDGIDTAGSEGGDVTTNDVQAAIVLPASTDATEYNFGELPPASLAGKVWVDWTDNGTFDAADDVALNGVTVTLTGTDDLGNPVSRTTTTAADGTYLFDQLRPGTYTVTETQPGGVFDANTLPPAGSLGGVVAANAHSTVTVAAGDNGLRYDFIEITPLSLSGMVWQDAVDDGTFDPADSGIGEVQIHLTGTDDQGTPVDLTTTTGIGGTYQFTGLRPGTYTVTEATQPVGLFDAGVNPPPGSVGGTVAPNSHTTVVLPPSTPGTDYDFIEVLPSSLTGTVWQDLADNGTFDAGDIDLAGVTIVLTGTDTAGNPVSLTTVTDASGVFSFTNLHPGTYSVAESTQPAGLLDAHVWPVAGSSGGVVDANGHTGIVLPPGTDATGYDVIEIAPIAISGHVWVDQTDDGAFGSGDTALGGVEVTLTGTDDLGQPVSLSTTTDIAGAYSFAGLRPGTYTVTETQPAGVFDARTLPPAGSEGGTVAANSHTTIVVVAGDDAVDYDFIEIEPVSISGHVYEDQNNDAGRNAGEPGIANVSVSLTGTDDLGQPVSMTTTTDSTGAYRFTGLRPGTYTVTESQPAAYLDHAETLGTGASTAGTIGADTFVSVGLNPGEDAVDYDFGEIQPSSISGRVWHDVTQDGVYTPNVDLPLGGVTVSLTGTDSLGLLVARTTTTNTDGTYSFEGLRPGTYTVTETQPLGYLDGQVVPAGSLGGTPGTVTHTDIRVGVGQHGVKYDYPETRLDNGSGGLPRTGNDVLDVLLYGATLVALGWLLLQVRRRRTPVHQA